MSFKSKLESYAGGYAAAAPYIFHRNRGLPAARALALAKADLIAGVARYPAEPSGAGAEFGDSDRLRWIERPADMGLRFLGFADELAGRAIEHRGWYTDDSESDVMRGAVYALPGRDGVTRILAAYRTGSTTRAGTWSDQSGDGESACVSFAQIWESEAREDARDYCDATRSACYAADGLAKSHAEAEREYQEAWQLGNQAREAVADARTARAAARDGLNELRGLDGSRLPALCARVRESIAADLARARAEYAKARELWNDNADVTGWRERLGAAFREAAGADSYAELIK